MVQENQKLNTSVETNEISLKSFVLKTRELWKYLVSKWILIVLFGLVGGAAGLFYSIVKKPVYTATTTFVLEDEKGSGGLGSLAGLASIAGVDLEGSGGGIFQGDNILGLYKSRAMLQKTLLTPVTIGESKQLLVDRYIEVNKLRDKWASKTELVNVKFSPDSVMGEKLRSETRLKDSILGVIVLDINNKYLSVFKPDKKTSTIQVDVKGNDEIFSKNFNEQLVKNVNEFYVNTKTKKTLQNVKILQHKTDSVRAVMNGAIYAAVLVSDATPNLNPTRQVQRVAPAQKAQFSAETNKSILAEMVKNLELTKMSLLKETPLIQVIDGPIYPLKRDKIGKIKGFVFGVFLLGILSILFLTIKKFLLSI